MKIQVYKCRFTGKIFEMADVKKYKKHLKDLRKEQKEKRKLDNIKKTFATWLATERAKITNVEQIIPWFLKNQRHIMDAHNAGCKSYRTWDTDKFHEADNFTDLKLSVKFDRCVSNSHVCPDTGVTNWCGRDAGPRGYSGFYGNINGVLQRDRKHNSAYPYGSALNLVGLKTGSGGGGNDHWSYEVSIFDADWPGLVETIYWPSLMEHLHESANIDEHNRYMCEQEAIVRRLKGV